MRKPRRTRFSAWNGRIAEIGNPDRDLSTTEPGLSVEPPDADFPLTEPEPPGPDQVTAATSSAPPTPPAPPPSWLRFLNSRRPQPTNKRSAGLFAAGCLALGLLGGYGLGRHAGKPIGVGTEDATHEGTVRLAANDLADLDAAYNARYLHRFAEAEQLFTALGRTHPNWPMMKVELGRTMLYAGRPVDARTALNDAAIRGVATAETHFSLGVVNLVEKNFREAETNLATAVAADPTRPDFFFLWGECLRDQGKPLEAADRFRSALLRNGYETADGLYRLKLWLSEIDASVENTDGLSAAIDTALAQPSPPMETLFAAAARDLKAGDIRAAGEHVRRARERLDPEVYPVIMNDPTFVQFRARLESVEPTASAPPAGSPMPPSAAAPAGK